MNRMLLIGFSLLGFAVWLSINPGILQYFSAPDRVSWGPLDGDWYAPGDGGCFRDSSVYQIRGTGIFVRHRGNEVQLADSLEAIPYSEISAAIPGFQSSDPKLRTNGLVVGMRAHSMSPGRVQAAVIVYEDYGDHLLPVAMRVEDELHLANGPLGPEIRKVYDLTRCSSPTFWGAVQTIWRRPYDPNANHKLAKIPSN